MVFNQILIIDEHPKDGCGAGPNIFSSDALALILSLCVFFFFLPLFKKLAPQPEHELCSR